MEVININSQSYLVDEEVAEQFSKFIRKANKMKNEIIELQMAITEIQDLSSEVSFFIENLDIDIKGRNKAFNITLDIGNKIRDLDLPEFSFS